jgi:hypothetical protein
MMRNEIDPEISFIDAVATVAGGCVDRGAGMRNHPGSCGIDFSRQGCCGPEEIRD